MSSGRQARRRATVALGLIALFAWCLLLFGIGLDDLLNSYTTPGAIFAVVFLTVLLVILGGLIWRFVAKPVRRRLTRH
jgi:hypothetical protein